MHTGRHWRNSRLAAFNIRPPAAGGRWLTAGGWRWFRIGLILAIGWGQTSQLAADPDSVRLDVLTAASWSPRWENLEGGPEWRQGPKPKQRAGRHWLDLQPGDSVLIQLPARAWLRALPAADEPLHAADLEWRLGNGHGLMARFEPQPLDDGFELRSRLPHPTLLRLSRPAHATGARRLALFLARVEAPPDLVRYRRQIDLPGTALRLSDARSGERARYWPLDAGRPMDLELSGPVRLRLESRLRLLDDNPADTHDYRLSRQLDADAVQHSRQLSVPEYRRALRLEGRPLALGTTEAGYVDIPSGTHRLRLSTDAPLLVRALALDEPDDWLARLNEPPPLREARQRSRRLTSCARLGDTGGLEAPPPVLDLMSLWCRAWDQARDNRYQPGGLAAASRLEMLAQAHPQLPELETAQERLSGRHGFYRALWPAEPVAALRPLAFPAPRLLETGESRLLWLDERQHLTLAERLPSALFAALEAGPLSYALPERAHDGRLRLAVIGRGALWLQFDQEPPRRLDIEPPQPESHFQLDPVAESLSVAGQTLTAPLSTRLGARPVARVALIELPLASSVSRLRLWRAEDEAGSLLWAALAYRAAKPYELPERAYLDLLHRLGASHAFASLSALVREEHADAQVRERALQRWSEQQATGVGPLRWREAPWLAVASAGAVWLEDSEQHQYQSYWRATPEQPLKLRLIGPARLRVSLRVLHATDEDQIEDWLLIANAAGTQRLALDTSRPVPGLTLVGQASERPGLRQEAILEIPAGEHEIALRPRQAPLLLAVDLHQPLIPWLGPLTPEAQALVRAGDWGGPISLDPAPASLPPEARSLSSAPLRIAGMTEPPAQLTEWLWRWEQDGERPAAALVAAGELIEAHPNDERMRALGRRLWRHTDWEPLETLEDGAGLTYPPVTAPPVISPTLRARLDLTEALAPDERLLSGPGLLYLDLDQPRARRLRLMLRLDGPKFLALEPIEVRIGIDDQPPRVVPLDAATPEHRIDLELPAGVHQIALQTPHAIVNQFIRVRLLEDDGRTPALEPPRYAYQVATHEQPVLAHVFGPAWIRIDEWRDGRVVSREQGVAAAGWQTLRLVPEAGRSERLLRVVVLTPQPERPSTATRPMPPSGPPLAREPETWPRIPPSLARPEPRLNRRPPSFGEEDGTWSANLAWKQLSGLEEEDSTSGTDLDRYLEWGVTYREYREESARW